jgi:anti-sigma B factor antagonist
MERIALDLTGVEFMDSAGLGVLVGCCKRLKAAGGDFAVVTDRPQLARLFEVTGLTEVFGVRATRGELGELVQA